MRLVLVALSLTVLGCASTSSSTVSTTTTAPATAPTAIPACEGSCKVGRWFKDNVKPMRVDDLGHATGGTHGYRK